MQVAIGVRTDGRKVVLSLASGYRESTESWSRFLRDLKQRGLAAPRLVVGDGHLGIWAALRNVYPQVEERVAGTITCSTYSANDSDPVAQGHGGHLILSQLSHPP